jgi:hypothetical protein
MSNGCKSHEQCHQLVPTRDENEGVWGLLVALKASSINGSKAESSTGHPRHIYNFIPSRTFNFMIATLEQYLGCPDKVALMFREIQDPDGQTTAI